MLCRAPQQAPGSFCVTVVLVLVLGFCGLFLEKTFPIFFIFFFPKGSQGLQILDLPEEKQRTRSLEDKVKVQCPGDTWTSI